MITGVPLTKTLELVDPVVDEAKIRALQDLELVSDWDQTSDIESDDESLEGETIEVQLRYDKEVQLLGCLFGTENLEKNRIKLLL